MKKTAHRLGMNGLLLILLVAAPHRALAWGHSGHQVIAQIALNNLDAPVKTQMLALARRVHLGETNYEFITLASWMDDVRDYPMFELLEEWHFINRRFIVNNAAPDVAPPAVNIQSVLDWSLRTLADTRSTNNVKSFALAYLLHLGGDVHQPLHCATRFTPDLPEGDRGGNHFKLTGTRRDNLHAFWDAGGGVFNFLYDLRPLDNGSNRARIQQFATRLTAQHPPASIANLDDLTPATWVEESHQLARTVVYEGITMNGTPDAAYRAKTRQISGRRMATAGYRLAKTLNRIFTPN
jgi:hypothetical protein